MRIIEAVLLLFCAVGVNQSPNGTTQASCKSSAQQTVAILLADNGGGPPGFLQTLVSQLGDAAAVGVIQCLGERKTTAAEDSVGPPEIRRILEIIRMAFAVPGDHPAGNRVPKATLVLLRYLSGLRTANSEKETLANTSKFVEQIKLIAANSSK